MKLNRLERHTAYIIMLAEMQNHADWFGGSWFCYLIRDTFGIDNLGFYKGHCDNPIDCVIHHFPELNNNFYKDKPNHYDFIKRRKILKQCIKETY